MILSRVYEVLTTVTHADGGFYDSEHSARQGFYWGFRDQLEYYENRSAWLLWSDERDVTIEVVWGEDFWDFMGRRVINDSL